MRASMKFDAAEARQDPGETLVLTLDEKIRTSRENGSGYPESSRAAAA